MEMNQIDKSNFFRGLLLLVSKDNKITNSEKESILSIGKSLGYSDDYCRSSVNEILINKYISNKPPKFTDKNTAKKFIDTGIQIAISDYNLHIEEINWIFETAKSNQIDRVWVEDRLIKMFKENGQNKEIIKP
ncbi:MAG: hypothetical protein PVH88_11995 [Ignavibacteria bacterium]|jgi:hypothetical protein